ncbi:phage portal protein, lambda family [Pseudomonas sp. GM18]|uniref:phage portal protein n=1 Tax=Pseudomonas sp. GM18 TaxID=1144324 RepID=UPI000272604F|nr:phage portal protein [Pseudomonas sp. GM18]EJM20179.1 phage portal protein, lambda family [Pseudomonas sp. GM18]
MTTETVILDSRGRPMTPMPLKATGNATRLTEGMGGQSVFPYEASNWSTQEMGDWLPWIRSPDAEINQFRDRMVARSRDLVRNDGWAAGGITRILDNTVGASLRLSANPDYRALAAMTGNRRFDASWAEEYRRTVEAMWRGYAEDIGRYSDVSRQLTISQQLRLALRHKLVDGDSLVIAHWKPERVGYGRATYATAFMLVDPDRLSNPYQMVDSKHMRGGVEIDDDGVPVAYHIRKAHQNDWYNSVESMEWERVEREDNDGWLRVIHDFERDRAGQNRGIGVFTPVLARFKMLARYYGVELQAATIAATFGTYVTSPYDPDQVQEALEETDQLSAYQGLRADWAEQRPAMLNGARIPTLAPGEAITSVGAAHPHNGFGDFAHEMLRTFAAAAGISAEQISQDWSKTNYSSARAALLESWKTLTRRNTEFKIGTATPMFSCWLHEAMDRNDLPLPNGAPDFMEARTAYSRCDWLGVARGWVDPVKEKQGAILGMDGGLSTLKRECAEQGLDYEEVIQQRKAEADAFKEAGLPPPNWFGANATDAAIPEQEPNAQ